MRSDERKRHLDPSVMIMGKLSAEKKKAQRSFSEPVELYVAFVIFFIVRDGHIHIEYNANNYLLIFSFSFFISLSKRSLPFNTSQKLLSLSEMILYILS